MANQPNIVVFFWDNFGWGGLGCCRGGVLRLGTSLRFAPMGKPKVAEATAQSESTAHVPAGTGAKAAT
jgi:arylsulfatase A-like enzyme